MESTESESKDRLFVTALARGLAVLAAFRGGEPQLSNQDLASRTGLPKSTVSRLTYTLTQLGYLDQDPASGRYQLGLAVLELSAATLASFDARRVIAPKMQQFAEAHGVSVSLAVREGLDMMYLETVRSRARVTVQLSVGSRVPLATTAIGRAYLAAMPAAERNTLMPALAVQYGADWPQIAASLDAALADYQQRGYCSSFGEFQPEVFAVAAPVPPLAPGQPWMSLNASGPAFLFTESAMRERIAPPLLALVLNDCKHVYWAKVSCLTAFVGALVAANKPQMRAIG
jgi:DNA-binding IclR family transcriptional regulator